MQRTYLALAALSLATAAALSSAAPNPLLANAMPSRAPLGQQQQRPSRTETSWAPSSIPLPPPPPPLQTDAQPGPLVVALEVVPYRP